MNLLRRPLLAALLGGVFALACSSDPAGGGPGGSISSGDGGNAAGADAGADAGFTEVLTNPNDPQNPNKDSDCDGLTDAEEFANVYAGGKKTKPGHPDTDGDEILDGVEAGRTSSVAATCSFAPDADPSSTTLPTEVDSDLDGLSDGIEDANRDGALGASETDPNDPDTDGDALADGLEDVNANGTVDSGETNPRLRDTDGDALSDGVERNVTGTNPTLADTDGDGCLDGAEDADQDGALDPGESSPLVAGDCGGGNLPDADSDGLPNVVEDADGDGVWDMGTETNFQSADTDGDALSDGLEDDNKNGIVNAGETNPRRKDSDCDGLIDGPTQGTAIGEDLDADGIVDPAETDPTKFDSDSDGLTDGVERGITVGGDPLCGSIAVDADPSTTTDPTNPDTDGDGISDGAEDSNQDGCFNCGGGAELNPKDAGDGTGPAGQACTTANLRPVLFEEDGTVDVQLGLPNTFTEVQTIAVGGTTRGMIGYDPTNKVAFLVYRRAAPASNVTADELAIRSTIAGVGTLTSPITQPFPTSWDGHPAVQAFYDQSGTADVKARANALAEALVGTGAGTLTGSAGASGPFKLQAQYVRRSAQSLIILIALAPTTNAPAGALFSMADAAGGSALAQFGDATAVQCETFKPGTGKVDFLFVVDDSCSMASSQTALGSAATAMANALGSSTLDYRIAMVTSEYHLSGTGQNRGVLRGFTTNLATFSAWLTRNPSCTGNQCSTACSAVSNGWVGICGSGAEGILGAARKATNDLTASGSANPVRSDAELVVVLLGDADDQTSGYTSTVNKTNSPSGTLEGVQSFIDFFTAAGATGQSTKNTLNKIIPVHGIVCPNNANNAGCGEWQETPLHRHGQVMVATSGIRGEISSTTSIQSTISAIVDNAIAASGHKTQKPPIGASVKVAVDAVLDSPVACNENDIPRSRTDGFDFNALTGTISFFGSCRPAQTSQKAAVSYRYWVDTTPNPDGNDPPCFNDPFYDASDPDFCQGRLECNRAQDVCECPAGCGGTAPPGTVCNSNKLVCDFVCTSDCGGACSGYQTCDQNACACQCVQNATCAPGHAFVNDGARCGCFCDTAALGCGLTYQADPNSCACVCRPNCGGCAANEQCNVSTCACEKELG